MTHSIWIGFDPREVDAYAVARSSIQRHEVRPYPIRPVHLPTLRARGIYTRPTEIRDGRLWDCISEAPCATEFSISRFLVPHLAGAGWALFMDSDMLIRSKISDLFALLDPTKALRDAEKAGDYTTRLALMEEQKSMPWSAVWDFYCEQNNCGVGIDWLATVKQYESEVLSKRA